MTVLTANQGNVEAAFQELNKVQLKPFLMRIWGQGDSSEVSSGPQIGWLAIILSTMRLKAAAPQRRSPARIQIIAPTILSDGFIFSPFAVGITGCEMRTHLCAAAACAVMAKIRKIRLGALMSVSKLSVWAGPLPNELFESFKKP